MGEKDPTKIDAFLFGWWSCFDLHLCLGEHSEAVHREPEVSGDAQAQLNLLVVIPLLLTTILY